MILLRQDDDRQFLLKLEEIKLQTLAGAIHAAAGNRKGMKSVNKIRLARRKRELPAYDDVVKLFGAVDDD
jgi:hypothetical protein